MRRKIGFFALGLSVCAFILLVVAGMCCNTPLAVFMALLHFSSMITAIICLIGDVIRFIGKCFSQGFSAGNSQGFRAGNSQECSQVCPLCGKAISSKARFCSECGCELTKKS